MAEHLVRYALEHKHDIWQIPPETRVLYVNCKLSHNSAVKVIERCRELERMVFSGYSYSLTSAETIKYLEDKVFVEIYGRSKGHGLDPRLADDIRHMYETGGHTIQSIAQELGLSENTVWHAIHERLKK